MAAERELIVGGDWYDVIETPRGELWLVMGDVAGHGVAATAQAGQLRHSLRVYAHEGYALAESLRRLNELLTGDEQARMATMCIVAVSDDPDDATIACAGHPPPLLLPAGGPPRLAECDTNVVLGVIGATRRATAAVRARGPERALHRRPDERPGRRSTPVSTASSSRGGVDGLAPLRTHS